MPHISLSGEEITHFGILPLTNSLLTTWLVMFFLTIFALTLNFKKERIPSKLQSVVEILIASLYSLFESVLGQKTKKFFPLLATLFIFIIVNNWVEIFPGVDSLGIKKIEYGKEAFIPLFRASTSDLNTTLALALIAVLALQYYGIRTLGVLSYLGKFINFKNPISFFVGILELTSEVTKVVSFAFRLFGNIFAGKVLLTVVAFLIPLFAPLPFLGLELFVGFIQALVFAMLTGAFLAVATAKAEH